MAVNDRFVLFADILGFGGFVLQEPEAVQQLRPVLNIPDNFTALHEWPFEDQSRLVTVFQNFHRAFDFHVHYHRRDDDETIAMSFSDSAFVSFESLEVLCGFARGLMRALIGMYVPARIGMAFGSVRPLRFLSDNTDSLHIHSSQFTGTGVVRSYYASEKNGLRGIGIFVHRSIEDHPGLHLAKLLPVTGAKPESDVYAQLNYLHQPWENYELLPKLARIDRLQKKLTAMMKLSPGKEEYYEFALASLREMIAACADDDH